MEQPSPVTGGLVLVLGSGRSGTHWVGELLGSHPELTATIEEPAFFQPVTAMALDRRCRPELFPKLVDAYRSRMDAVAPLRLADKSHPNIWLADDLAAAIPNTRFVGIQRSVEGTVASMLKHPGVLGWHGRWREFPVPNPFLGITDANTNEYDSLSTVAKCVLRWNSHRVRMSELRDRLGERLLVLDYEAMIVDPAPAMSDLTRHLGLEKPFPAVEIRAASLDRWRTELSGDDLGEIAKTLARLRR